jgi:predicted amidohydrolase YtcJ
MKNKTKLALILSGLGLFLPIPGKTLAAAQLEQRLLFGGPIVTMEASQPAAEAVVTAGDSIVYVGGLEEASERYPGAAPFDLAGHTLMPGFIEQHLHPFLGALALQMAVIAPEAWQLPGKLWPAASGSADYLDKLAKAESSTEDSAEVLWSWGYNHYFHGELSRDQLDKISATRPIVVWHRSCHEFYLNSAAIERFGLKQEDIDQLGPEASSQIDLAAGHFYEAGGLLYLLPRLQPELASQQRLVAGLRQMITLLHRRGVTAFMEPGALIAPGSEQLYKAILGHPETPLYSFFVPESKSAFMESGSEGLLPAIARSRETLPATGKVRFLEGQLKLLADGAIISQLMQMRDGYSDGHHGEWIQPPEELEAISKVAWEAGYQLHVHVNGDAGLDSVLDLFSRRMQETPRQDHRSVIVHFANSAPDQVQRIQQLGLQVSANPYYVTGFAEQFAESGLRVERAHAMVRLGPLEAQGTRVSLHSDLPMAPADPLYLAWAAVNRLGASGTPLRPDLALSLDAALRAITIDAAYSWRMEHQLGSIKPGKIANFTLLARNPYTVDKRELKDIAVIGTFFEGRYFPVP